MLNPNAPGPSTAKKAAMQKRLNKTANKASDNQATNLEIDDYYKRLDKQVQSDKKNSSDIGKMIDRKVQWGTDNPGPKFKPGNLKLSPNGPHDVFNSKAKIDNSQIQDRVQSEAMDHFISRLAEHKSQNFMEQYLAHHPNSNKSLPDTHSHEGEVITGVGYKGKGTKNKEALLKRLREK